MRRSIILLAVLGAACAERAPDPAAPDAALLDLDAPALATELAAGRVTAERVTAAALARIAALDDAGPTLAAIIELNPDALAIARSLDARFAAGGPVGPLHGLPVVLKANIDTADALATTAGSRALAGHRAAADADLVARLRAAGAVIVAKANLSEWANFRGFPSTSGWSSLGDQTRNPYVLDRNPCGSSSGSAVAVAARLVPLAVGTETDGSIVCPAGANGVVGIKPTHGTVSTRGIIPIAASQDTAGPIARTVAGAAMLLAAMREPISAAGGAHVDAAADPVGGEDASSADTVSGTSRAATDRSGGLESFARWREDLRGVRLGVVRDYAGAGSDVSVEAEFTRALARLASAGATLVDPIAVDVPDTVGEGELTVLLHEFKAGINAYLAVAGVEPGSLAALIAYNDEHAAEVMPHFGQDLFVMAEATAGLDAPAYGEAVAASQTEMRRRLAAVLAAHELDALVAPTGPPAWRTDWTNGDTFSVSSASLAAISGYPSVAVPSGLVGELPVAIAFIGAPFSEQALIEIAAVFERERGPFPAPRFLETLPP